MLAIYQKIKNAEQRLDDLIHYHKPLDIPGNFRAKQRRAKHDDSRLVFPTPKRKETESYKTHYTLNFKSHPNGRPSSPRPCSPTRRNNPHPSKNFLNWRIPTRVFDYGKEKHPNIALLRSNIQDTYHSFYDDYAGLKKREIDGKMLLELTKGYRTQKREKGKQNRILLSPLMDLQKGKLSSQMLRNWSPSQATNELPQRKGRKHDAVSPLFKSSDFQPLFQSWYDAATKAQKEDVDVKTSEEAFQIEDTYLKEVLTMALKPKAVQAIEDWLLDANEEERSYALQFIQTIILASLDNKEVPCDPKRPPKIATPHHNHQGNRKCNVCRRQEWETALQELQTIASSSSEVPGVTELLNPLHQSVIAGKAPHISKRKIHRPQQQTGFIANKGSLFAVSRTPKKKHFTIHPEWN